MIKLPILVSHNWGVKFFGFMLQHDQGFRQISVLIHSYVLLSNIIVFSALLIAIKNHHKIYDLTENLVDKMIIKLAFVIQGLKTHKFIILTNRY